MNKIEFDEKYVKNNKVTSCRTADEAKKFLALADKFGYKWQNGDSYSDYDHWNIHKDSTCYRLCDGSVFSYFHFYKTKHNIVNYTNEELTIPIYLFRVTFRAIKHISECEAVMIDNAEIAVQAKNAEDAKNIGIEYAKLAKIYWSDIRVKEYSKIYTKESLEDLRIAKMDIRLKDGTRMTFDERSEFRDYCENNGINYDFKSGVMLKNNELFGVFSDMCQQIPESSLRMLK